MDCFVAAIRSMKTQAERSTKAANRFLISISEGGVEARIYMAQAKRAWSITVVRGKSQGTLAVGDLIQQRGGQHLQFPTGPAQAHQPHFQLPGQPQSPTFH